MRHSLLSKPQWIYDGEILAGIALGSDACAEHEWGVKDQIREFGCDSSGVLDGIERRRIRTLPEGLRFLVGTKKKVGDSIFLVSTKSCYKQPEEWLKDPEFKGYGDPLVCAWDEKSFGIVAYGEKDRVNLKTIWEAFQNKDIAFWTNIGVFHNGGGLVFCIVSKVPEKDKQKMLDQDQDHKLLKQAAQQIGIEERLTKAGRRWFALTPSWSDEHQGKATSHPVLFWLNPYDQGAYNFGWFTVEQLEEWAEGKGPIVKGQPTP